MGMAEFARTAYPVIAKKTGDPAPMRTNSNGEPITWLALEALLDAVNCGVDLRCRKIQVGDPSKTELSQN